MQTFTISILIFDSIVFNFFLIVFVVFVLIWLYKLVASLIVGG